jgi:putative ABC transport system permease protein
MCKGMLAMLHMADRYQPTQTLTFNVHLPVARYDTPAKLAGWYDQSLAKLRALPGAARSDVTSALPYSDWGWIDGCQIENRPQRSGDSPSALRLPVSAGYFGAFQIPIIDGRGFGPGDDLQTKKVAVVSRAFVARYFPGQSPLGHRIRMVTGTPDETPWLTIVGVAEEANYSLWLRDRPPAVYMDAAQLPPTGMTYVITTKGDPLALAPAARKALAAIDPGLPLDEMQTYANFLHEKLTGMFYVAAMLGFDALVALLLAAIGIFGVMANLVGERTREIGVRLAMGARREDVLRMILRRAGWLTGIGVCAGLLLAFGLAHGVANLLYDVRPDDPVVFGSITAVIAGVALLASWVPARKASRIDPMVALRDQ